ncbi:MAG: hypothetical protein LBT53_10295 [Puniceicoccales bacterium]|jgi:hypothetical protein|nr:hypothetical protein [Puniceicoccales bacterium]
MKTIIVITKINEYADIADHPFVAAKALHLTEGALFDFLVKCGLPCGSSLQIEDDVERLEKWAKTPIDFNDLEKINQIINQQKLDFAKSFLLDTEELEEKERGTEIFPSVLEYRKTQIGDTQYYILPCYCSYSQSPSFLRYAPDEIDEETNHPYRKGLLQAIQKQFLPLPNDEKNMIRIHKPEWDAPDIVPEELAPYLKHIHSFHHNDAVHQEMRDLRNKPVSPIGQSHATLPELADARKPPSAQ